MISPSEVSCCCPLLRPRPRRKKAERATEKMDEEKILCGDVMQLPIPPIALGKALFGAMRSFPQSMTMMIQAEDDTSVTVGEVLQKSVGVSVSLTEMGVSKGDHVVLIGENTINLNIAALGVLFINAAMCPVDPALKSFEFQHIFGVIIPKVIICDYDVMTEVRDALEKLEMDVPLIAAGTVEDETTTLESLFIETSVDEFIPVDTEDQLNEIAVIANSSGTTGLPKGVGINHYAFIYQSTLLKAIFQPGLVVLSTSYFYWISGLMMLMGGSMLGITRVLVKDTNALQALQAIDKYKAMLSLVSPSFLQTIVSHPQFDEFDVSSMKILYLGGSALMKPLWEIAREKFPGCNVLQTYGATEVSGLLTMNRPPMDPTSVGKVLINIKIKILDRDTDEILGANEEGLIKAQTPCMMVGYVNNEDATREAIDEEGWYNTGDIGKYDDQGQLFITGRAKELMKVDNHQIAPAEIESVILRVPGVMEVAVVGVDIDENTLPMALVVKEEGTDVSEDDIIQAVQENLSEYKQLRAGVFFVEELPRTSSGKLKRGAIEKMAMELYSN